MKILNLINRAEDEKYRAYKAKIVMECACNDCGNAFACVSNTINDKVICPKCKKENIDIYLKNRKRININEARSLINDIVL